MIDSRHWPLLGAVAGLVVGLADGALLSLLGFEVTLGARDGFPFVIAFFTASFVALGWMLGRVNQQRRQARRDAAVIEEQIHALEESQQRLVQAQKLAAIGRLAASIAHEVRNPLGVIKSSAALAKDAVPAADAGANTALGFVVEECDRLDAMITALLAFARPAPLTVQNVDARQLRDRATHLAREEAERRGLAFSSDGEPPASLRGDPDLLCNVLFGLVVNAAEAAGGGGRVALRSGDTGGDAVFEVADDGPGVPNDHRERLFEPFFSTKETGTGLGLATAARVVQAHGGSLELVDGGGLGPNGAGACFRVRLPGGQLMAHVLVVDDERRMADIVRLVLERAGHSVRTARRGADALTLLADAPSDVLLTDLKMPGMSGLELLAAVREEHPRLPVVLMTAFATVQNAIDALRLGAFDYIRKPFDNADLVAVVERAHETAVLRRENAVLKAELRHEQGPSGVIAESDGMQQVLDVVQRVARSRSTVLITGESGTGKEVVARALHAHSDRVGAAFVAVNAKALADGVLESELFGHEKGAFTGANRARAGLFERADGGTLFLDEIGEIGPDFQGKLLRVLQEREVQRVGGERTRSVDVRLVAATNRDLEAEVRDGRFREDLYFRLAVIPLHIPPLRERRDDVMPLAQHFLARQAREQGRAFAGFSPEVEAWMASHEWPGNVREVENAVERGAVLCRGDVIQHEDLLLRSGSSAAPASATLQDALDAATRGAVQGALRSAGGVKTDAAAILGVDRTTLYRLMKRHDVE